MESGGFAGSVWNGSVPARVGSILGECCSIFGSACSWSVFICFMIDCFDFPGHWIHDQQSRNCFEGVRIGDRRIIISESGAPVHRFFSTPSQKDSWYTDNYQGAADSFPQTGSLLFHFVQVPEKLFIINLFRSAHNVLVTDCSRTSALHSFYNNGWRRKIPVGQNITNWDLNFSFLTVTINRTKKWFKGYCSGRLE